jgi:hypothetical protein
MLHAHKYYRISPYEQDLYERLLKEWEIWCEVCDELMRETTRAANWVATVVRRELNPMFYVLEGKFYLTEGSHWRTSTVHEYTSDQIVTLSQSIDERLKSIIAPYRNQSARPTLS